MTMTMNKQTIKNLLAEEETYRDFVAEWLLDHADTLVGPEGQPPRRPPITRETAEDLNLPMQDDRIKRIFAVMDENPYAITKWLATEIKDMLDPDRVPGKSFQERATVWALQCFGDDSVHSLPERFDRFLEEAIEFAQSVGYRHGQVQKILDYVYDDKQPGEPEQELGGVMVTLGVLCQSADLNMNIAGEKELARCWQNTEKIRLKNDTKPRQHTAMPAIKRSGIYPWASSIAAEVSKVNADVEAAKDAAVKNAVDLHVCDEDCK